MTSSIRKQIPAPRQLSMTFDSMKLRGICPVERSKVIALLTRLLMEAAGAAAEELADDER